MKKILLPFLLSLAVLLTSCGGSEPEITPETAAPAQNPASAEEIAENPFGVYFDLSALSQDALADARQVIDQRSTQDGVTVHVSQTLGDGMSLYVALEVVYPPGETPDNSLTSGVGPALTLTTGKVTDPAQVAALPTQIHASLNASRTQDNVYSLIAEFTFWEPCLTGQEVTLLVADQDLGTNHLFTWTAENTGTIRHADLTTSSGEPAGSATLSAFALNLDLPDLDYETYEAWNSFVQTLSLLDAQGQPLDVPWSWQGGDGRLYLQFVVPLNPSSVASIQAVERSAAFQ